MEYTIPYREICYLVNRSWMCFIDQTPDSCLIQLWIFIHHACFHPLHHNHDIKEAFVSFSSTFTTRPFQSMTVLHTIFAMLVYIKKPLTPCCDLPKQSTCPLYLFSLLYSNFQIATTSKSINDALEIPR
jgi:hypothetical protein